MIDSRNRRRYFFANQMHKELFWIVCGAAVIPTVITAIFLYYLIFNITTEEIGIPESIAAHVIPAAKQVSAILWVTVPIVIAFILVVAHKLSHRIVGPFDRIIREMDEHIQGRRSGTIKLRDNDRLNPLVDRINVLLNLSRNRGEGGAA